MTRSLQNRVAIRSGLVVAITIGVAVGSIFSVAKLLTISNQINHSHRIIESLKDLKSLARTVESSQRGFLLTGGNAGYLEPYERSAAIHGRTLRELAALTVNDSYERQHAADILGSLFAQKFAEMDETIRLWKNGNPRAALDLVKTDRGKLILERIESLIDRTERSEKAKIASMSDLNLLVRNVKIGLTVVSTIFTVAILLAVYVVVGREMCERKRVEDELARTRDLAEAANRAKGDFMANVSHEIRTPMNAILGMTEVTLETALTPHQRENLQIVQSATDSLLSIINDLLDFSKMEAGKLTLDPDDFGLRDELGMTMDLLALRAAEKGLEIACRIDPGVPERLVGDMTRIRQVIMNLVGNAIKFTAKGEVVVEVGAELRPGGVMELHFRVSDTGIGIAPENREMVFAPFTQADGSTSRVYGGSGLGLSISSQLASLMGGRIWVDSELGVGSTFHFTAEVRLSYAQLPHGPTSLASLRGLKVLVVDDIAVNRRILEEILTAWQMLPTLAAGGVEAIVAWERARDEGSPFSLILLDVMMPDMDGFAVASRIKQEHGILANVILMLTSSDRQGFPDEVVRAGITACLKKPIHQNKLLDEILSAVVPTHRSRVEAFREPTPKVATRPLRILMAEDNPHNQRVATLILAKSGHAVTVASNGLEAVEALKRDRYDIVLMDLQMPVMDGLQATTIIRSAEAETLSRVPIIALTAHAMKEDRERCLSAGMDGYVSKPIQESSLLKAILACVPAENQTSVSQTGGRDPLDPSGSINLIVALERVDGDRQFLAEMAGMFVAEAPPMLALIRVALASGDLPSVVEPAHSLKNWCGNFVAMTAFDALANLEKLGRAGRLSEARACLPGLEVEFEQINRTLAQYDPRSQPSESDLILSTEPNGQWSPPCTL